MRFRRKLHLRTLINLINLITLITLEMSRKKIPRRNTRRALEQYVTHARRALEQYVTHARRARDTSSFAYTFWARVPALLPHRCMSKHTHTHTYRQLYGVHTGGALPRKTRVLTCAHVCSGSLRDNQLVANQASLASARE